KVSVFSDLNNLKDISMDERFVDICGITEKEIHDNLEAELHQLAEKQKMSYEQVCAELKECYDGYHFMENTIGIYNPFSLLNTFDKMKFGSYWFETGTPTYLVNLLKKHHYDLERMAHEETDEQVLNSIDSESTNPIPVIYQSGYLTIKGYDEEFGMYRLGFPNREVEEGFVRFLLP
ncbi:MULTISPECIES: AAA family ATPase, partial [Bacteroides]